MHHLSLEDEASWLREAVLQALNSSVSSRESVRDQKEFHRGHAKPLRGASKDSPQEAAAHGEEGGPHLTLSVRSHRALCSMRLRARQLCLPWTREGERQPFASWNHNHHAPASSPFLRRHEVAALPLSHSHLPPGELYQVGRHAWGKGSCRCA